MNERDEQGLTTADNDRRAKLAQADAVEIASPARIVLLPVLILEETVRSFVDSLASRLVDTSSRAIAFYVTARGHLHRVTLADLEAGMPRGPVVAEPVDLLTENGELREALRKAAEELGGAHAGIDALVKERAGMRRSLTFLRGVLEGLADEVGLATEDIAGIVRAVRGRDGASLRAKEHAKAIDRIGQTLGVLENETVEAAAERVREDAGAGRRLAREFFRASEAAFEKEGAPYVNAPEAFEALRAWAGSDG